MSDIYQALRSNSQGSHFLQSAAEVVKSSSAAFSPSFNKYMVRPPVHELWQRLAVACQSSAPLHPDAGSASILFHQSREPLVAPEIPVSRKYAEPAPVV